MEFLRKCCIGIIPYYTYGDYVCFKNITDTPNEHHNHFILNRIPYFHITSPFKLCDDIFESFPKLFVDKMVKQCIKSHVQIMDQLPQFNVWGGKNGKI